MIRAYINIVYGSGTIKYVRDSVVRGKDEEIYHFGDTLGDTLSQQTGAGKVLGDYLSLLENLSDTTEEFLLFPESSGDTASISRRNYNQADGVDYANIELTGDSLILPKITFSIKRSGVRLINIVEERVGAYSRDDFYEKKTNTYKRDDYIIYDKKISPLVLGDVSSLINFFGDSIDVLLPKAKGGVPPYTYSASNLPGGTNLVNREVVGTISSGGLLIAEYEATDANGNTVTKRFYWKVIPGLPGTPSNLIITKVSSSSLNIEWDAPTNNGGDSDLSYRIDKSEDGASFEILIPKNDDEDYGDSDSIMIGNTYYYRIYSINSKGTSDYIGDSYYLSSLSFSFALSDRTDDYKDNVNFILPEGSGGGDSYGYTLNDLPPGASFTIGTREVSGTLNRIGNYNIEYVVEDNDSTSIGDSFSWTVQATLSSVVRNLNLSRSNKLNIMVDWDVPSNNGGDSDLIYHYILIPPEQSQSTGTLSESDYNINTNSIPGLFKFSVLTNNDRGDGPSVGDSFEHYLIRFGDSLSNRTNNFGDTGVSYTLPAAEGGNSPYNYSIDGIISGISFSSTNRRLTGTINERAGTDIITYYVYDNDGDTIGDSFDWIINALNPDPPASFIATGDTDNNLVSMTWTIPISDGGADINQYNIRRGDTDGSLVPGTFLEVNANGRTRSVSFSNFNNYRASDGKIILYIRSRNTSNLYSDYIGDSTYITPP